MQNNTKPCRQRQGFTLAEILIVLAIIAVLVGVSIPIFTTQIKKSQIATNQANIRSAKAAVTANYLQYETGKYATYVYNINTGKLVVFTSANASTYMSKVDSKNTVCCVAEGSDVTKNMNLSYAQTIATYVMKRIGGYTTVNGVFPYIGVVVNNDGTMTTNPYYSSSSNMILTDAYK